MAAIYADFPDTVEVMHDRTFDTLAALVDERPGYYDILWIGRTHNLDALKELVATWRARSDLRIVLDTEAITATRHQQMALMTGGQRFDLREAMRAEFANVGLCDAIVAVSEQEAVALRGLGLGPVSVLGTVRDVRLTPRGFYDRRGLLFVGAMHQQASPNYDSLCWFVEHVLPLVIAGLGPEARLTIAGYTSTGVDMSRFTDHPNVTLRGVVPDTTDLHDTHRVFVAPTRIAAGVPYKVHEAASLGLPVVASLVLQRTARMEARSRCSPRIPKIRPRSPRTSCSVPCGVALAASPKRAPRARLARENSREAYRRALENIVCPPPNCEAPHATLQAASQLDT